MNPHPDVDTAPVDALSPSQQRRLTDVLEQYLADLQRGLSPDANQLVAEYPDLAAPLEAYLGSLDFLHRATLSLNPAPRALTDAADLSEGRLGDYKIIREIGRGGMGIVYEARQISLDRPVALKVLPFAAVLDQKQIARFSNEARAAAQLHHRNIVPVYAVGCERGVHYYAMQYIEGQPLDLAIGELRRSTDPKPAVAPRPDPNDERALNGSTGRPFSTSLSRANQNHFRTVAELGVQVADALQHAHDYGIIHRDVKPSNLLLDQRGDVWITDFGLARFQRDARVTATGDVMGTVRYMSPEQAAGKSALVDQRTDVYSLGITLYELLTHHDAFEDADRGEFLRRIEEEEPRRPRRINPAIPVDLETIVLKAIAKSPQGRYSTAQELADDLGRFLEGKPTLARRPTLADRAGKWAKRHKTAVRFALASTLLCVVGLVVTTLLVAAALSEARANYRRADAHFRQARRAVDRFATQHAEQLAGVPQTEQLRRQLLDDALGYYHEFISLVGDDPDLQADLAVTYFKAARVTEQIGDSQKALDAYRQARQVLLGLVRNQPHVHKNRADLALCHNNIGLLLSQTGDTGEAENAYRQAIEIQTRLVEHHPAFPDYSNDLATSYGNLGLLQSQTNRIGEAESSYRATLEAQQQLVRAYPDEPKYLRNLAVSHSNLAALSSTSDPAEAERRYRDGLSLQKGLVESYPHDVKYKSDLALSYNNLGAIQSRGGRLDEAKDSYRQAIAIQQQLLEESPLLLHVRRDLAISHNNLGRVHSQSQQPAEAHETFGRARDILQELIDDFPNELSYRSSFGGVFNNQGMVLEQLGRPDDAVAAYRAAAEHQRFALQHAPDVARFREFLSKHYGNLARVLRAVDRADEAAEAALARRDLWPDHPPITQTSKQLTDDVTATRAEKSIP